MTALDEMLHAQPQEGPWVVEVYRAGTDTLISRSTRFDDLAAAERFAEKAELAPNTRVVLRSVGADDDRTA